MGQERPGKRNIITQDQQWSCLADPAVLPGQIGAQPLKLIFVQGSLDNGGHSSNIGVQFSFHLVQPGQNLFRVGVLELSM